MTVFKAGAYKEKSEFDKRIFTSSKFDAKADIITDWQKECKVKIDDTIY